MRAVQHLSRLVATIGLAAVGLVPPLAAAQTRAPRAAPARCAAIPDNVKATFDVEGPSPYTADGCSMVFDALAARYLTSSGNGWRHELKIPTALRTGMTRSIESLEADFRVDLSPGGKMIVTQYHAEGTGTIVKVYVADSAESGFFNSVPKDGVFDVYARILPAGSSTEQKMALGTITSGQSFRLAVSNVLGRVTVSAFGRTMTAMVDDGGASYLKFGNYLQSQDPFTNASCSPFASCYAQFGIVDARVTMSNVVYSRANAPDPVPDPNPSPAPAPLAEWKFEDLAFPAVVSSASPAYALKDALVPSSTASARDVFSAVAGRSGYALMMTQDASRANYPLVKSGNGDYSFAATPGMSIEMWIRPAAHSATKADTLISLNTGSVAGCSYNSTNSGYSLKLNTNGTLVLALNGNLGKVTSAKAVPDHAWTHVVATYDKAQMRIYLNGALSASSPYTAAIVAPVAATSGPGLMECSNLKIGGSTTTASTDTGNFQGQLDEVRLYGVGLTAAQVSARFAAF